MTVTPAVTLRVDPPPIEKFPPPETVMALAARVVPLPSVSAPLLLIVMLVKVRFELGGSARLSETVRFPLAARTSTVPAAPAFPALPPLAVTYTRLNPSRTADTKTFVNGKTALDAGVVPRLIEIRHELQQHIGGSRPLRRVPTTPYGERKQVGPMTRAVYAEVWAVAASRCTRCSSATTVNNAHHSGNPYSDSRRLN